MDIAPTAGFTGSPTGGLAPLLVAFTDESLPGSSEITGWEWDFGDGGTSTAQHPEHTYSVHGGYTVSLTVTTSVGADAELRTDYILVEDGQFVTFADPTLEESVLAALGRGPGAQVTPAEMATISELNLGGLFHEDFGTLPLSGIEHCTSLRSLVCTFEDWQLTDEQLSARLTEIAALTELRELIIHGGPFVGSCHLWPFSVLGAQVDVSPLAALTNLEYLVLFVHTASLAPLQALDSLDEVISSAATPEEIAQVASLTQVSTLKLPKLWWDDPEQLAPLAGMAGLRDLKLEQVVPTLDTQALTAIPQVDTLQVCRAGDFSLAAAADFVLAFPNLRDLTLGRPCVDENDILFSDYSPLAQLTGLERLVFYTPREAVDFAFLLALNNLGELQCLQPHLMGGLQDLSPLVTALTDSPRPFRLVMDCYLTEEACAEQAPVLYQMPGVTLEGRILECIDGG